MKPRIESVDLVRGLAMLLMALDHVRMYFAQGTWYSDPTDLATTTPLLFFTRWITHICAPAFVFLAGTALSLRASKVANTRSLAGFALSRGLWLVFAEIVVVNFAWTFDVTYSFVILQVIWAIGVSMIALSGLVFLPRAAILVIGMVLVFGHNLLDGITGPRGVLAGLVWFALHDPQVVDLNGRLINIVYPVLPWIGVMALGYVCGGLYDSEFSSGRRRKILWSAGIAASALFLVLRGLNLYGEPNPWHAQSSPVFTLLSFLNTTKYPPSLHFLLMTMGPVLLLLAVADSVKLPALKPLAVFGRVPFFYYIVHLFLIHALAMAWLASTDRHWTDYVLSAAALGSGRLAHAGLGLGAVFLIWMGVVALFYPLCRWFAGYKERNPSRWWISFV